MKFFKLLILILLIISFSSKSTNSFLEINNYINKGFSFINSQSSLIENPSSLLSKYNIFDYKINLKALTSNQTAPDFIIYKVLNQDKTDQVKLQDYTTEEIQKFNDFQMKGQQVLISNFLVSRSRLLAKKEKLNTIVYFSQRKSFSIKINKKNNFPTLTQVFIKDAVNIFYEFTKKVEITDLKDNEKFIRKGIMFFTKYGTHYLSKLVFGSKFGIVTDMIEKELIKMGSKQDVSLDLTKNAFSGLDKAINNINKYKFSNDKIVLLGDCKLDEKSKSISNCDEKLENMNLISYETIPIYQVFNKELYSTSVKLEEKEVSITVLNIIKANVQILLKNLESALSVDLPIIHQIDVFNNVKNDYEDKIGCLKINKNPEFTLYNSNPMSIFSSEKLVDKKIPIFNLDAKNAIMNQDLPLIEDKNGYKTYACVVKKSAANIEDIMNGILFKEKFVKNAIITAEDKYANKVDWECKQFWAEETTVNYLCLNMTRNFLDQDLIVDIKFKRFQDVLCENFTFNDRNYTCDCQTDITSLVKDSSLTNIFMCITRKNS